MAPRQADRGSNLCSVACMRCVFPVCCLAVTGVTISITTHTHDHFTILGLEPLVPETEGRAGPIASTGGWPGLQPGEHYAVCAQCISGMLPPFAIRDSGKGGWDTFPFSHGDRPSEARTDIVKKYTAFLIKAVS